MHVYVTYVAYVYIYMYRCVYVWTTPHEKPRSLGRLLIAATPYQTSRKRLAKLLKTSDEATDKDTIKESCRFDIGRLYEKSSKLSRHTLKDNQKNKFIRNTHTRTHAACTSTRTHLHSCTHIRMQTNICVGNYGLF